MDQSGYGAPFGYNHKKIIPDEDDQDLQNTRPTNRRKTNGAAGEVQNDDFFLDLSLGRPCTPSPMVQPTPSTSSQQPSPILDFLLPLSTPPPPPEVDFFSPCLELRAVLIPRPQNPAPKSAVKTRRRSTVSGEIETVPPPYPWATNQRGRIHSLEYLESKQITMITGDVQCKYCEQIQEISYDLREKFREVERFIEENKDKMRERAPTAWMNPVAMRCNICEKERAVKPVIGDRKREINWLFLLLGMNLGYCTLAQLKYFCKHSNNHRTGAKDRVLFLTYLALCKMLKPCDDLFQR